MFSLTYIYIYFLQSTLKFTMSQTDESFANTTETDHPTETETDIPTNTVSDTSETTTPGFNTTYYDDKSDTPDPKTTTTTPIAITTDQSKLTSEVTEVTTKIATTLATNKIHTPSVELIISKELHVTEQVTPSSDLISTTKIMPVTTESHQASNVQIEPFSTFLKKLLIYLCVKRSSDLRQLMESFLNHVQELLQSGTVDVLGEEVKAYIGDLITKTNASTIYMLRYQFGEYQLMLMNRGKNSDDLLAFMDDIYEVAEEEAMQRVLNDVTRFPNGNKNARRIARGFLTNVFLKPMNRTAGTIEGDQLFSWIKNIFKSSNSNNITKQILRQKQYVATKASTKYVHPDFMNDESIYSDNDRKIRNNIEHIESILREGQLNDKEEDVQNSNEESESYETSEENYKLILSTEKFMKEGRENEDEYSNEKQTDEDRYEPIRDSQSEKEPLGNKKGNHNKPSISEREELNLQFNSQVEPGHIKENSDETFVKISPLIEGEKGAQLQLPRPVFRVRLTDYNKKKSNTSRIPKPEEFLKKRKASENNRREKYFDKKRNVAEDTEKTYSLSNDGAEKSIDKQINNELHKKLEPMVLRKKFPFINKKNKESSPIINARPRNTIINKSVAKMKQLLTTKNHGFYDKIQPKVPHEAKKERAKNYKTNRQLHKSLFLRSKKVNIVRKNTDDRQKDIKLPNETEKQKYSDEKSSQIFTEESMVWSGIHSSPNSEISNSNSENQDSELSSDFKDLDAAQKRMNNVIKKNNFVADDYDDGDLRMRNGDAQKLPDKYRLTTRYRGEERRAFEYRLKNKPYNELQIHSNGNRKGFLDRRRNTATENKATVFKVTKHNDGEMKLKEGLRVFFRNLDFVKYNATRNTAIHDSATTVHLQDDAMNTDEEAVLKRNIYKAMKKLLKK